TINRRLQPDPPIIPSGQSDRFPSTPYSPVRSWFPWHGRDSQHRYPSSGSRRRHRYVIHLAINRCIIRARNLNSPTEFDSHRTQTITPRNGGDSTRRHPLLHRHRLCPLMTDNDRQELCTRERHETEKRLLTVESIS